MNELTQSVAFISEHASPLADLGGVDTGGQKVYVGPIACHLSKQGNKIDGFSRRENDEQEEIVNWIDGVRIIHVTAGPAKPVIKEEILQYMPEFQNNMVEF